MSHDVYIKKRDTILDSYAMRLGVNDWLHERKRFEDAIDRLVLEVIGEEPGTLTSLKPRVESKRVWREDVRIRLDLRSSQRQTVGGTI